MKHHNEKVVLNPLFAPYLWALLHEAPTVSVVRIPVTNFNKKKSEKPLQPKQQHIIRPPKTPVNPLATIGVEPQKDPRYWLAKIATLFDVEIPVAAEMLRKIYNVCPGALLNIILMVIAKELDMNYSDHISKAPHVFIYNTMDSKIYCTSVALIKKVAFKYFAAFRTKEEAVFGIRMASAVRNLLLSDGGK